MVRIVHLLGAWSPDHCNKTGGDSAASLKTTTAPRGRCWTRCARRSEAEAELQAGAHFIAVANRGDVDMHAERRQSKPHGRDAGIAVAEVVPIAEAELHSMTNIEL